MLHTVGGSPTREWIPSRGTATIDGYTVEGHVPADVIDRILAERPDIRGVAVPGMPAGSPGMESDHPVSYNVLAVDKAGGLTVLETRNP